MNHQNHQLHDFMGELLKDAANLLMGYFGHTLDVAEKTDSSLVTNADLACDKLILERIGNQFPNDKILSEETGLSSGDRTPGTYIWVVDPLDGTTNFSNAYPFFSTSIARGVFGEDGRVIVMDAGIVDPVRQKFFQARRGFGATCNGKPMSVHQGRPFKDCFLVTGFYYFQGKALMREFERLMEIAAGCQTIRRDGSAALDLAFVAAGIYDAFWENGLKPWDVAAGSLLVEESGGIVENYLPAGAFDIHGEGLVSGAPHAVQGIRHHGWKM